MKAIPTVQKFMSAAPHSIGVDQPLSRAHAMLRDHRVRHLPVLRGGRLVGLLTERDLHLIESLAGVDQDTTRVDEAMATSVYAVPPDTPLDEVVEEMAQHRYGSVVVMESDRVVGIFTTVDACRALAELLRARAVA